MKAIETRFFRFFESIKKMSEKCVITLWNQSFLQLFDTKKDIKKFYYMHKMNNNNIFETPNINKFESKCGNSVQKRI